MNGFRSWTRRIGSAIITSALLAAHAASALAQGAEPIPARTFFRPPDLAEAQLSPSGRWLAVKVGAANGRFALAVFDIQGTVPPQPIAHFKDIDVGRFSWVGDERLVFDLDDLQRGVGELRYAPGLFSIKRDGTEMRQLVKMQYSFVTTLAQPGTRLLEPWHQLLQVLPGGGETGTEVIVGELLFSASREVTGLVPKRLDIVTGRTRGIARGTPSGATGWLFDASGAPRLAVVARDGRSSVYWRADLADESQQAWRLLSEHETLQPPWTPRFIDRRGNLYVARGDGPEGEAALFRYDFAAGRPEAQPLVRTPGFDFIGRIFAEDAGGEAMGVRVFTDAETTVWFNAGLKALQEEIDRRLPGRINSLSCRRCSSDDRTVLVHSYSDREPGDYWVWRGSVQQPQLWVRVGAARKDVDPQRMGALDLHRVPARDGRGLPVWVTLPARSAAAGSKPAAVVLVHGGPWVRGTLWQWDGMAQFLASRGYVVIEPEFRGSAGYGERHFRAGWKQWGRAMQDDVADAVQWAAAQGLIDPQRVCIAGASYGGYATLMGLVRHGNLYRCGAAWVAVSEPRLLFKSSWANDASYEDRHYRLPVLIGDPDADAALLAEASAVEQAAAIRAPVLLAYGEDDRRVPLEHGKRMREALRKAGNEPEWVVYEAEGHSWRRLESRLDFAERLESFLARHLSSPNTPPKRLGPP